MDFLSIFFIFHDLYSFQSIAEFRQIKLVLQVDACLPLVILVLSTEQASVS